MNSMTAIQFATEQIKEAFFEGYYSYVTTDISALSPDEAWEQSDAKEIYDALSHKTEW